MRATTRGERCGTQRRLSHPRSRRVRGCAGRRRFAGRTRRLTASGLEPVEHQRGGVAGAFGAGIGAGVPDRGEGACDQCRQVLSVTSVRMAPAARVRSSKSATLCVGLAARSGVAVRKSSSAASSAPFTAAFLAPPARWRPVFFGSPPRGQQRHHDDSHDRGDDRDDERPCAQVRAPATPARIAWITATKAREPHGSPEPGPLALGCIVVSYRPRPCNPYYGA
jgi:hypothetical protein